MATIPEDVFTRRLALASEYVESVQNVAADGFTDEYFTVLIDQPTLTARHEHASVTRTSTSGEHERYRVWWESIDVERAAAAMEGDFRESIGASASDAIDAVRERLTRLRG